MFGSGLTALGVVQALGRGGVPLHVACPTSALVRASRWFRPPPRSGRLTTLAELPAYLDALPLDRAVLIPTSDDSARAIADLPPELARRFPCSQAPRETLAALIDKAELARVLHRHGVPQPWTRLDASADDVDTLSDAEIQRLFVKPRHSQAFDRRFGIKALRPRDRRALRCTLSALAHEGLPVILQEYVPGPPTSHYFLDGFVDRTGRMRACLARRRLRMAPAAFGNSCATVSVPIDEAAEAAASLRRLLASVDYRGPFDAEFKRDDRDGVFRLLEINVRPWWQIELASHCGIDVAGMCYRDALGLPVAEVDGYRTGITWVLPIHDLTAAVRLLRSGEFAVGAWARSWLTAHWAGFAADDPLPGLVQSLDLFPQLARRLLPGSRRPARRIAMAARGAVPAEAAPVGPDVTARSA